MDGITERFKTHVLVPVVVALAVGLTALALALSPSDDVIQAVARATPAPVAATATPTPLSKARFLKEADHWCGKLDKVTLDQNASGLEDSAKDIAKFRKQLVSGLDKILSLAPPAKDRKFIEKYFFTPVRDDKKVITVYLKRMEKAFRDGDLVALAQLRSVGYGDVGSFNNNVPKLQKYGFRVCVPPPQEPYVAPQYIPPPPTYVPPAQPYDPYYPTPQPYVPPSDPYYPTYPTPTPTPFIDIGL